ncbi:TOMM precursor leader peptide-binding protein [Paenibacillus sp. MBLB4367]|uniref:TOMM precursor leader peptide-binding protein n=1 Tax=Paenibacillus sp. MBLB4367 TaxID=3384767 RepID=UPI0039080B57
MKAVVAIVGEGMLANYVSEQMSGMRIGTVRLNHLVDEASLTADLVLVLHDAWNPALHRKAEEVLLPAGIPWLRGFVAFGEGVIGPLVRPGSPGCSQCADRRMLMAGRERPEMWRLRESLAARGGGSRDAWASRTGLLQMAHLISEETKNMLTGQPIRTAGQVVLINLNSLESSCHFVMPDSLCKVCSMQADDSATEASIRLKPSPKISPDSYRSRSLHEWKNVLIGDYLDFRTGMFNGNMQDLVSPFADASVNLPLFTEDVGTAGRTHSYAVSKLTAVLEGLERYSSLEPRGKRTVVHGSYRELQAQALDPVQAGLHTKEQYALPSYRFQPFDPDRPIRWVWGYSFGQERPLLVPEQLAFYSMGGSYRFAFESSNGCALGGSLEEAILYGLLETVERDSFLMTWYAQLPIPRLDLASADDPELDLMIGRLAAVTGYDLHVYASTMEHGIPSVWGIAKNRNHTGANLVCSAGAHPDPVRAVKGAVHEIAGLLNNLDRRIETDREKGLRMYHDSSLVKQMEDHSLLYALPIAESRLHFIMDENRPMRTFAEAFKPTPRHSDLTEELRELIQALKKSGLDVVVIDLTAPEIGRNGLHCVKVLIPGTLPMTFGHHFTRLSGLGRVLRVPMELGYVQKPLTPDQLNPYPHPFP